MVARRLCALGCFLAAGAAIAGAIALFNTGFVGPAPLALGGAGGLIAAGVAIWRGPDRRAGRGRYPT
jgi:hypothetical protein